MPVTERHATEVKAVTERLVPYLPRDAAAGYRDVLGWNAVAIPIRVSEAHLRAMESSPYVCGYWVKEFIDKADSRKRAATVRLVKEALEDLPMDWRDPEEWWMSKV